MCIEVISNSYQDFYHFDVTFEEILCANERLAQGHPRFHSRVSTFGCLGGNTSLQSSGCVILFCMFGLSTSRCLMLPVFPFPFSLSHRQ